MYQLVIQKGIPTEVYALPPEMTLMFPIKVLDTAPTRAAAYIKLLKLAERLKRNPVMVPTPEEHRKIMAERQERARLRRLGLLDE